MLVKGSLYHILCTDYLASATGVRMHLTTFLDVPMLMHGFPDSYLSLNLGCVCIHHPCHRSICCTNLYYLVVSEHICPPNASMKDQDCLPITYCHYTQKLEIRHTHNRLIQHIQQKVHLYTLYGNVTLEQNHWKAFQPQLTFDTVLKENTINF